VRPRLRRRPLVASPVRRNRRERDRRGAARHRLANDRGDADDDAVRGGVRDRGTDARTAAAR
jgi:hypothetical protein